MNNSHSKLQRSTAKKKLPQIKLVGGSVWEPKLRNRSRYLEHALLTYSLILLQFCQMLLGSLNVILSRAGVTLDGILVRMIAFIVPYTLTQIGTTGNTALSL
jgi:hypothetical protein